MTTLIEKLGRVRDLRVEAAKKTEHLRAQIMALEKEMETINAPYEALWEGLEKDIEFQVMAAGKSCKTDIATVTYRKGYTRTTWDGKGLAGFAVACPEVNAFRKETEVQPSVSWRWNSL